LVYRRAPRAGTASDEPRGGTALAGVDDQHLLLRGNPRNPRLPRVLADAVLLHPLPVRKIERLGIVVVPSRHGFAVSAEIEDEDVPEFGFCGNTLKGGADAFFGDLFIQQRSDEDSIGTEERLASLAPVLASQMRVVLSPEPVTMRAPSDVTATLVTRPVSPLRLASSAPVLASQMRARSRSPAAQHRPGIWTARAVPRLAF
jgi:hypothetical protein